MMAKTTTRKSPSKRSASGKRSAVPGRRSTSTPNKAGAKAGTGKSTASAAAPAKASAVKPRAAKSATASKRNSASARMRAALEAEVAATKGAASTPAAPRTPTAPVAPSARPPVKKRTAPLRHTTPPVHEGSEVVHVLNVPFAMREMARQAGAVWAPELKCTIWRGGTLPPALEPFAAQPWSWEQYRQDDINGVRRPPSPPAKDIAPRDHQNDAIRDIQRAYRIKRVGYLLADDVGLGKTITSWKAIAALPNVRSVLIVCPLAVVAHWRRTIEWCGDEGKVVVIINYDRLSRLFEVSDPDEDGADAPRKRKRKRKPTLKGIARAGKAIRFDAVIWDEAHRLRNPDTARSRLSLKINRKAGFRLWLSATAGQNPLELNYLAPLLAQMTGSKAAEMEDFGEWCEGQRLGVSKGEFGRLLWNGGVEECQRVHQLLFGGAIPAGLRRRPEDIAGWPEITRSLLPIDLSPDERLLYEAAWQEFRRQMALSAQGPYSRKDAANALVARLRFRQKSSLLRVPGSLDLTRSLLDNGRRVAVSVAFIETQQAIRAALEKDGIGCALIDGSLDAGEKERQRLLFQTGQRPVCLFTVTEGISLHQGEHENVPRAEIIHDLRWSAIEQAQIEGRTHRDGQHSPIYWAFAAGTVEERIVEVVLDRMLSMKTMAGDDTTTLEMIEEALRAA